MAARAFRIEELVGDPAAPRRAPRAELAAEAALMARIVHFALGRVPEGLIAGPARIALDRLHELAVGETPMKPLPSPAEGLRPPCGTAEWNVSAPPAEPGLAELAFVEVAARAAGLPEVAVLQFRRDEGQPMTVPEQKAWDRVVRFASIVMTAAATGHAPRILAAGARA